MPYVLDTRYLLQSTLDSSITKTPQFTPEGLMEHIGEMLVSDHSAILIVDKQPFRRLIKFTRPNIRDSDIPHRREARQWILDKAGMVVSRLRDIFTVSV
jgi:hypothetical protein